MRFFIFIILIILFTGCGKYDLKNRLNLANKLSSQNNFTKLDIKIDIFNIRTYNKFNKNNTLKIYIEGDGFSWINRYTISPNPTPINPIALKLASLDQYNNISYIARPCQYNIDKLCDKRYWTDEKFSKQIINSINKTISILKKQSNSNSIELIGYSGGAAITLLVANLRDDIIKITTIAGNLNHKLLHKYHNITQIKNSLNPIDIAKNISYIPQIHYIGLKDKVIPKIISSSFKQASNNIKNIKIIKVPNASHTRGWISYFNNH